MSLVLSKGDCLVVRAGATVLQNALEFARNRVQPGLQARSVQFATAKSPSGGEQAFHWPDAWEFRAEYQ